MGGWRHPPGNTGWAHAGFLEMVVLLVFWFLAGTSNLPVVFHVKHQTSPHQKLNVVPVCSGEVLGNVWWEQGGGLGGVGGRLELKGRRRSFPLESLTYLKNERLNLTVLITTKTQAPPLECKLFADRDQVMFSTR